MKRKRLSEINAGSMADIAFLLLIFFLVTTTMDIDKGIFRKMAQKDENPSTLELNNRNVLEININRNNEILVGDDLISIKELSAITQNFIDNGGGKDTKGNVCDWCKGQKKNNLSDHPTKALITITADRNAKYETYVAVLDRVHYAYTKLRNTLALQLYRKTYVELEEKFKKTRSNQILEKVKLIRSKYPMLIGDIETTMASK
ncbi:ExbD/TolR family protein [Tenacibaculum agarivorans]|uniref:ExbD/TolR family protein n=1 Tax=Tenacibaculum agarivorans TaxID=1908389 RepID=UPI00094BAF24|nr:biopolymer transporter ExbD [Tenacibaculum agarivorans]